jgi:hypothetical protein
LGGGGGAGSRGGRAVRVRGALDGDLLPALVPGAAAGAGAGGVLRTARGGGAGGLSRVPALPAGRDRGHAARGHGGGHLPPHRGARRRAVDAGRPRRPGGPEPGARAARVQGDNGRDTAAVRGRRAAAAAATGVARGPGRDDGAIRRGLQRAEPVVRAGPSATGHDAGHVPARRPRRAHRLHDGGLPAGAPPGGRHGAGRLRGGTRGRGRGPRSRAAAQLPTRDDRARRRGARRRGGGDLAASGGRAAHAGPADRRAGHGLPAARVASAAGHPLWRNADLRRARGGHRRAAGGAGGGPRLRHEPGGADRALPPGGGGRWRAHRLLLGAGAQGRAAGR